MRQRCRLIGHTPCCMLAEKACIGEDTLLVSRAAQRYVSHSAGAKAHDAGVTQGLATAHACGMRGVQHYITIINSSYTAICRPVYPRTFLQKPKVPLTAPQKRTHPIVPPLPVRLLNVRSQASFAIHCSEQPPSAVPLSRAASVCSVCHAKTRNKPGIAAAAALHLP